MIVETMCVISISAPRGHLAVLNRVGFLLWRHLQERSFAFDQVLLM